MPSARRHPSSKEVVTLMEGWPQSWAGTHEDEPVGRRLVAALQRFMTHLQQPGRSSRTLRRHLDNLWLIGSEIIRQLDHDPALRDKPTHALLLEAIPRPPWFATSRRSSRPPSMPRHERYSSSSLPRTPGRAANPQRDGRGTTGSPLVYP